MVVPDAVRSPTFHNFAPRWAWWLGTFPLIVLADTYESTVSISNPDLTKACGLNVDDPRRVRVDRLLTCYDEVQDAFRALRRLLERLPLPGWGSTWTGSWIRVRPGPMRRSAWRSWDSTRTRQLSRGRSARSSTTS